MPTSVNLPSDLPASFNVADHFILPHLAPERAGRTYLHCGDAALTFGDLHEQANRVAGALWGLGVRPGDRIVLLMRESLTFPAVFWGAVRCGALPVPLNTVLTAHEVRHYLADSEARVLIVDQALLPQVEAAFAQQPTLRHILTVFGGAADVISNSGETDGDLSRNAGGDAKGGVGIEYTPLETLTAAASPEFETVPTHPDNPAFWLYTSGSTGAPKAAVHRQRDMVHVAQSYLRQVLRLSEDDLTFSAPKLFFAYGLGNTLYFPLATGSAAVLHPGPVTAASAFKLLAQRRPSVFYAVPSLFRDMIVLYEGMHSGRVDVPAGLPSPDNLRLDHLRMAISGGEALPPAIFEAWRKHFGHPILDGVGSTEALHFYLANTPEDAAPGSAGRPVPGYDLRLVDEGGQNVCPGEEGALWLRGCDGGAPEQAGAPIAMEYWRNPQRNRAAFRGGWFATGDRFVMDEEGRYRYQGRNDVGFKVGGSWVNPEQVEQALLAHPGVTECAVVGHPGDGGLTEAHAHIVPDREGLPAGADPAGFEATLRAYLANRIAPFKIPARFIFVQDLPRTASGKLQRHRVQANPAGSTSEIADDRFETQP